MSLTLEFVNITAKLNRFHEYYVDVRLKSEFKGYVRLIIPVEVSKFVDVSERSRTLTIQEESVDIRIMEEKKYVVIKRKKLSK